MEFLWDGIKIGFALSLLVGPIIFTLMQTSIEQGFRAGWTVGLGIWSSDLMFVLLTYFGISYVIAFTKWNGFEMTLGICGGIILVFFGLISLLIKPPTFELSEKSVRYSSYFSLWIKGFVINSINPFSFFFWIGMSSVLFAKKNMELQDAGFFYAGLLGTLVVSDTIKISLAKVIRRWLKPVFILWMRRIAGVALIIFGIILFTRTFTSF